MHENVQTIGIRVVSRKGTRTSDRLNSRVVKSLIARTLFYTHRRNKTVTCQVVAQGHFQSVCLRRALPHGNDLLFNPVEIYFSLIGGARCSRIDTERNRSSLMSFQFSAGPEVP